MSAPTGEGFFHGLQLSLTHFLGMTIGAGLAIPIVIHVEPWNFFEQPSFKNGVMIGSYTVAIVLLGTWTFLGSLGGWAGRHGGTSTRLIVQVSGIVIMAYIGLALSILVTLIVMNIVGSFAEDRNKDPMATAPHDQI